MLETKAMSHLVTKQARDGCSSLGDDTIPCLANVMPQVGAGHRIEERRKVFPGSLGRGPCPLDQLPARRAAQGIVISHAFIQLKPPKDLGPAHVSIAMRTIVKVTHHVPG